MGRKVKFIHKNKFTKGIKKISICFCLICTMVLCGGIKYEITYANTLSLYSKAYALTDGNNGRVLVGENETKPMANASTTKILTCIVTLENSSMDEMVTISANASSQPKVRLGMGEGEIYPLKDMLYGLMLESYNDCAVAIAEHIAGSVEEFAKLLNQKAKELGCKDTYFITPNGLDAQTENTFHHTTAQDLCLIMSYCTWESPKSEQFLEITQTSNYSGGTKGQTYSFVNRNSFLNQMDGVLTGKTGYTSKAGYCYVAALERNGERFCIALLACGWPDNKNWKWQDAKELLNYGIENYDNQELKKHTICEKIMVDGYVDRPLFGFINQEMYVNAIGEQQQLNFLCKEGERVYKEIVWKEDISLPINKGEILGNCYIYLEDEQILEVPLKAEYACDEWKLADVMKSIFFQFVRF